MHKNEVAGTPFRFRFGAVLAAARWQAVHHAPILALVALLALATRTLRATHDIAVGGQVSLAYAGIWAISLAVLVGSLLAGEALHHLFHVRPLSWRGFLETVRSKDYFTRRRVALAIVPLALVPTMAAFFTIIKWSIPEVAGFRFDRMLMTLDTRLHGGAHPWELLQPILGHPYATLVVDRLYGAWYVLLYLVLLVQILDRAPDRHRGDALPGGDPGRVGSSRLALRGGRLRVDHRHGCDLVRGGPPVAAASAFRRAVPDRRARDSARTAPPIRRRGPAPSCGVTGTAAPKTRDRAGSSAARG